MELAQVNVAVMRADLNDPVMAGFVLAYDCIARLAEASPGFVWRLKSARGHEPVVFTCDGGRQDPAHPMVANVSVWSDYASLHRFTYRSAHNTMLRHRNDWFLPTQQPSTALWWVESGTCPTVEQALRRLSYLRLYGPSPRAFSLLNQFDERGRPTRRGGRAGRSTITR